MNLVSVFVLILFFSSGCASSYRLTKAEERSIRKLRKQYTEHYGFNLERITKVKSERYKTSSGYAACVDYRDGERILIFNSSINLTAKGRVQVAHLCAIKRFYYGDYAEFIYF